MNDPTNTTTAGERLRQLNTRQLRALPVLLAGGTQQQAADAAGVQRTTVTYWVNHHPGFQAAINAHHHAVNTALLSKRLRGAELVLDHLLAGVENGDEAAIQLWLRHIGVAAAPPDTLGTVEPDEIIERRVAPLAEAAAADRSEANIASLSPILMEGTTRREVRELYEASLAARLDHLEETDADDQS